MFGRRGERAPVAIVMGTDPAIGHCSVTNLDELAVAGGLRGAPVDVIKCQSHDLVVPASAEIVIERWVRHDDLVPEGPFGEYTSYMGPATQSYRVDLTCVTHRNKPIYRASSVKCRRVNRAASGRSGARRPSCTISGTHSGCRSPRFTCLNRAHPLVWSLSRCAIQDPGRRGRRSTAPSRTIPRWGYSRSWSTTTSTSATSVPGQLCAAARASRRGLQELAALLGQLTNHRKGAHPSLEHVDVK